MVRMFTQRLSVPATGKIDDETKSIDMTLQQLVDQFNTLQGPSKPDLTCTPTQAHISGNELCRLVHSEGNDLLIFSGSFTIFFAGEMGKLLNSQC